MVFNLEIKDTPYDIKIELIKPGVLFPKLILEVEIDSTESFLILESKVNFIFKKEIGNESISIYCEPYEKIINKSTKYFKFYTYLTKELLQYIETYRAGGNLKVNLNIENLYLLKFETLGTFNHIQGSNMEILKGEISTENILIIQRPIYKNSPHFLIITRDEWCRKVLNPFNSIDRFIIEIPYFLPELSLISNNKTELNELKNRIIRGINILKKIIKEYTTTKDSEKCIDRIRETIDLLYNIPRKQLLYEIYGKYLIEKTCTASNNISKDIIENIFSIVDALFNISSKGPHAVTRNKDPMEYYPKYEDADTLLGITTLIYYFLSKKFEKLFSL
ncbi:MAG: hypothetical protein ACTSRP_13650 [Candidatus Helarchaeota archaeon]